MFFTPDEEATIANDVTFFAEDMQKYLDSGLSFKEALATYFVTCHDYGKAFIVFKQALEERPNSSYAENCLRTLSETRNRIINSPIFGKKYVITGALLGMERATALTLIRFFGGKISDSPVNDMDVLVVGYCEWSELNNGKPTRKILKAQELQQRGRNIQIISDEEFINELSSIAKHILSENDYHYFFCNTDITA